LPEPEKERRIAAVRLEPELGYPESAAVLEPVTFEVSEGKMGLTRLSSSLALTIFPISVGQKPDHLTLFATRHSLAL